MFDTLQESSGIGLAANQVGVSKQVFIIRIPFIEPKEGEEIIEEKKWWHDKDFVFINPKIVKTSGKTTYQEGCLSFPTIFENIVRASNVSISYQDLEGKEQSLDADGLFAICIQHEYDHLQGISFADRMSRFKSVFVRKKLVRLAQNNWVEL